MPEQQKKNQRPFIGIMFKCCNVYSRIYLNKKNDAFVGWCPKCAKQAIIRISPDGEDSSFFEVS